MSAKIKVLIADDHSVIRAGIGTILSLTDDIEVVGEAANGKAAVELVKKLAPDVVIMDLMMPVMDGVAATAAIVAARPSTKVLVFTTFGSSDDVARALEAGALGVVVKTALDESLVSAIRLVAAGKRAVAPEVARFLKESSSSGRLTDRQLEILQAVARGLTNQDIATAFGITLDGVKAHLRLIYAKLGTANRSETVSLALRKQLIKM